MPSPQLSIEARSQDASGLLRRLTAAACARWIVCLLLVLAAAIVNGDEPPAPTLPDPADLSGDWWTYFEPREPLDAEALQKRVAAAAEFYTTLRQRLLDAGDPATAQRVDKILARIDRFLELKNLPDPVAVPGVAPQETYSFDDALGRFEEWLTLKQQVDAESQEIAWSTTVLNERRKQQSRLRSRYLDMDERSPERLASGVDLIEKRLLLELRQMELDRRGLQLEQSAENLRSRRHELDAIPGQLVATPEEIARWEREYAQAEQAAAGLREETAENDLRDLPSGVGSTELSEPQFAALETVRREMEIRVEEIIAERAQLAISLARLVTGEPTVDNIAIRGSIDEFAALGAMIAEEAGRWRAVIERLRAMLTSPELQSLQATQPARYTRVQRQLEQSDQLLRLLERETATAGYVAEMLTARLHAAEGWWQRNWHDFSDNATRAGAAALDLLGATMFEINETPVTPMGVLRVILILTIALWLSRVLRRTIHRVGERRGGLSQSSLYTFGRLLHYVILTIGIIIGLSSIGIDFTKFALFASALGVGIGFGLQTLISNFVAGLIILFEKSLKVGDFVELESGVTGEVKEINMRSTLITTNDNIDILVPNSEFVGGRVINWTLREAYRRVRVPFGVAYGTEKEKVRQAVLEAAGNVSWTLKTDLRRQPQVWLVEFGDNSLNFELVVWLTPEAVKRPGAVIAAYLWEIESKLREYSIEIPFPQRDLHVRSLFGLRDEAASRMFTRGDDRGDKPDK